MSVKLTYDTIYDNIDLLLENSYAYIDDVVAMFRQFSALGKIIHFETTVNVDTLTRTHVITFANQHAWDEYNAGLQALEAIGPLMNSGYTERNTYVEYDDGSREYFN